MCRNKSILTLIKEFAIYTDKRSGVFGKSLNLRSCGGKLKFISILILIIISWALGNSAHSDDSGIVKLLNTFNRINHSQQSENHCPPTDPEFTSEADRWQGAGFGNPEIRSLNLNPANYSTIDFTHEIDFTLVMFRNAGWTPEVVKSTMENVAGIYGQCGIRIGKAKLMILDAPSGLVDIDEPWKGRDLTIAKMTPTTEKPILYFVRSSNDGSTAWAGPKYWTGNSELLDTAWITNDVNSQSYKVYRDPKYSPTAHEIAHVLGNCGHVKDSTRNILGNSASTVNDKITPEQCITFKKHKSVRKL